MTQGIPESTASPVPRGAGERITGHWRLISVLRAGLRRALNVSILAVFALAGWWLRPDYPQWVGLLPYYLGFLIAIPTVLTIALWVICGLPGLSGALSDARRWWLLAVAGLTYWGILSPTWSRFANPSYSAAGQLLLVALFTLAVTCAGPSARAITLALALGLVWQSVIMAAQFAVQRSIGLADLGEFALWPGRAGVSVVAAGNDSLIRPYGLMAHPNMIGGYLAVGLLALTGWFSALEGRIARWRWAVRGGVWALGLWALCLTFSRGAWLGFGGGLLVIALARMRPAARRAGLTRLTWARIGGALAISVGVGLAFAAAYPQYLLARAGTGEQVTELRSVSDRQVFAEIAQWIISKHPIAGVGIGASAWEAAQILPNTPYRELRAQNVHNLPLLVMSELGIVGVALWAAELLIGVLLAWRRAVDPYAVGLAAGGAALLVIGMVDHYPWAILHFALLLHACLASAIRRESVGHPSTTAQPARHDLGEVGLSPQ